MRNCFNDDHRVYDLRKDMQEEIRLLYKEIRDLHSNVATLAQDNMSLKNEIAELRKQIQQNPIDKFRPRLPILEK